jgi:hypothetical protein
MVIPSIQEREWIKRREDYDFIIYTTDAGLIVAENKDGEPQFWDPTNAGKVIQNAISNVVDLGKILFKSGIYDVYSTITIDKEVELDLGKAVINLKNPTTLFNITRGLLRVKRGIIWGQNKSGEIAFLVNGVPGCLFEDVRFDHIYYPFYLKGSVWELRIYGCLADYCQSLIMTDTNATDININMRDTWATNVGGDGIIIYKSNGILMHNCEVIKVLNGSPLKILSRAGGDIWISECEFDNYKYPVEIGPDVPDYHIVHSYFAQGVAVAGGHALLLHDGCYGGRITGCHIGSKGGHGIYIVGTSLATNIVDNRIGVETGNYSILLESATRVNVLFNQVNQPITETGVSDWNFFMGNTGLINKIGLHSKVISGMDHEFDQIKYESYLIPLGLSGVYGNPVIDIHPSGHFRIPFIRIITETVGSNETITVKITAYYDDDTSQYIERSYTTSGAFDLAIHDLWDLMKNTRRMVKLEFRAKTNLSSSTAKVYRQIWGI